MILLLTGGFTDRGAQYQKSYFLSRYDKSYWAESKAICKTFNLELATIKTLAEAHSVLGMVDCSNYLRATNENYTWIDGITLTPGSQTD